MDEYFELDGQPQFIISGSLHYFRVPSAYWRDRLRKMKAAGLNSVSTFIEWSYHEPEERQYIFNGDRNVVKFIKTAAQEDLYVLIRPGPYIGAERDMGGLPYWLLGKYPDMMLRSSDKDFMEETKIWMEILFARLSPLLFGNGGPIILVQVENKYGVIGSDVTYKTKLRDIISKHVDRKALLYTTDLGTYDSFVAGAIPSTITTIVTHDPLEDLRKLMPLGPFINSELTTGWWTYWSVPKYWTYQDMITDHLEYMLKKNVHVNFYMFAGGTNFGFTSGATFNGSYIPVTTSFDSDAPLSEAGDPTPTYYAIKDVLKKYGFATDLLRPTKSVKGAYGVVKVVGKINLFSKKGRALLSKRYGVIRDKVLPTFEQLRQRCGLMLYETELDSVNGSLFIRMPRDMVYVFVDGVPQGIISRMHQKHTLQLVSRVGSTLSLLVENQGRVDHGIGLRDHKGILSHVIYSFNVILDGPWKITGYPLHSVNFNYTANKKHIARGPIIYEGLFTLPKGQKPLDTFLDTTGWVKGFVWINDHNLGRYWPQIGPQVTLYVPGVWLRAAPAHNRLQILELIKAPLHLTIQFIDHPILDVPTTLFPNDIKI
ncbi:hypothetical protein K1T71_003837 [Dendrolimus kikuchii]|uniref:Uncharacterized protein n=1 Tax=Dendrolimus kikuchii TaxID=765133 RepID=A0ACC1DA16_9NEOP|nr:hypothetical protein K1T71_003837 [Dendrolimus kikuchii]